MEEWQSGLSSYGILRRSPLQDVVMLSVHIEDIFMYNSRQSRVPYEVHFSLEPYLERQFLCTQWVCSQCYWSNWHKIKRVKFPLQNPNCSRKHKLFLHMWEWTSYIYVSFLFTICKLSKTVEYTMSAEGVGLTVQKMIYWFWISFSLLDDTSKCLLCARSVFSFLPIKTY